MDPMHAEAFVSNDVVNFKGDSEYFNGFGIK